MLEWGLYYCHKKQPSIKTIIPNSKATKRYFGEKNEKDDIIDNDEQELAESLEKENWISDLDKKEKNQYAENALYSLNTKKVRRDGMNAV